LPVAKIDKVSIFNGICRIFNRGSFGNGGRYYGAWRNILKEDRTLITINRQPTAELDFRCMQPQLTYASVEV
jgi:hypothetical protein